MDSIHIRTVADDGDLRAWGDAWNQLRPQLAESFEELRHNMGWAPPGGLLYVLALDGDRVVGIAEAQQRRFTPGTTRLGGDVLVAPDMQRRGIGHRLYEAISQFARTRGGDGLAIPAFASDDQGLPFWSHRGFVEVERYIDVGLDLASVEVPPTQLPDGVSIVSLAEHPELAPAHRDIIAACLDDVPSAERHTVPEFEEWRTLVQQAPYFDPRACLLAVVADGDGLRGIGVAELEIQNARPGIAWHGFTAVLHDWRRRGIARALKYAIIARARELGLHLLLTENEERNTPMRTINDALGYRPQPERVLLHGPLAGASDAG